MKDSRQDSIFARDIRFQYQLLKKMKQECEHYLGKGIRNTKNLWAGSEEGQIKIMKTLYASFPDEGKPEWLLYEQILIYEALMTRKDYKLHNRCFEAFLEYFRFEYGRKLSDEDVKIIHDNIDMHNGHLDDDVTEEEMERLTEDFVIHSPDFIADLPCMQGVELH